MDDLVADIIRANTRLTRIEATLEHFAGDLKLIKRAAIVSGCSGVVASGGILSLLI